MPVLSTGGSCNVPPSSVITPSGCGMAVAAPATTTAVAVNGATATGLLVDRMTTDCVTGAGVGVIGVAGVFPCPGKTSVGCAVSVADGTNVGIGVSVGAGVAGIAVRVNGVLVGASVSVRVGSGVFVGKSVLVSVGMAVSVNVGSGVLVGGAVGTLVFVSVCVGIGVAVAVGEVLGVMVGGKVAEFVTLGEGNSAT